MFLFVLILVRAGTAGAQVDYGPSGLFTDPALGDGVLPSELAAHLRTIDEIKDLSLEDLRHEHGGWNPVNPHVEDDIQVPSMPGYHTVTVYNGEFTSGVYVAPRAQALVDYVGKDFPHFPKEPTPGLKGNLGHLANNIMPVYLNHSYEVILPGLPGDFDWNSPLAGYGVVAVTQHADPDPETIEAMGRKSRQIAVKYGLPVLHVEDLLTFSRMTCADEDGHFCNYPNERLGYSGGNDLIRLTTSLLPALEENGVPISDPEHRFVFASFAMYAYAQAYTGSVTFLRRALEALAEYELGGPPPPGLAAKVVTGGGSKDGGAALYATDVDDRIVAAFPSGFDILDVAGEGGFVDRWRTNWGRCGDEEDWVYIPGPDACSLGWLNQTPGGEAFLQYWDLYNIIPQYDTSFDHGGGMRDLFMVYKWSTHDLHYPLGSSLDFWWDSPNFDELDYRHSISVNHDHGGSYEPDAGAGEPDEPELGGWDLMLGRLLDGREPVDIRIAWEYDDPVTPTEVIVTGTITSPDGHPVEGGRYFVAQSEDRNFSLAEGIESIEWSPYPELPFSKLGNEGLMQDGPYGPEGSTYGGFSWTYVATNDAGDPVDEYGNVIQEPWGAGNDEVIYLYPFPPDVHGWSPPPGVMENSGLFVRYPLQQHLQVTSGTFGVDSEVGFEVTLPLDPDRAMAVFFNGWDRDPTGNVTRDFSRFFIANEQEKLDPDCGC